MSRVSFFLLAGLLSGGSLLAADYPVRPVPFTAVTLTAGLWHARQETNCRITLPFALQQCAVSKRIDNFDLAAETMQRRTAGETHFQNVPATKFPFDDSDVFKALEGAAYCLSLQPDPEVQKRVDGFIARIAAAQEPDGYLYTFRTMHPDSPVNSRMDAQRWLKDSQASHELYNIAHLYEAGVAHAQADPASILLDVCLKNAELLQRDFGDGQPQIAPGHPGIEMALAKLYRQTADRRWLGLAKFFLDARGFSNNPYNQNHKPVIQQREAVGHAVRANYLYSGMADVAALAGDPRYLEAITAIWEDVVGSKLHLTGGCGALADGEAYGAAYELPHQCYNETCAAVGFLLWNQRMFLMTGDGKYMDVFERTLHNGFLSGVSLSGDRFFYPNPLAYDGKEAFNHDHAGRAPWFGCACCPPNVLRTMASLGGYVYATQADRLYVNLYASSVARVDIQGSSVKIEQKTDYPWDGTISLTVDPRQPIPFTLCVRIPHWVRGRPLPSDLYTYDDPTPAAWSVSVNGKSLAVELKNGYATIDRTWQAGDAVTVRLPMPPRRVTANPRVAAARGQIALERGPIVYCLEGIDNGGSVFDCVVPAGATVVPVRKPALLGGVVVLEIADAQRLSATPDGQETQRMMPAVAVPYAFWNNRGLTPMTVWVHASTESHGR